MPLQILSYKDLYGWTMDEIVAEVGHFLKINTIRNRDNYFLSTGHTFMCNSLST